MIIVLEGLDGAGKSTSVEFLETKFRELGYEVIVGFEPGGTFASNAIRHTAKTAEMSKLSQTLLMAAARTENHIDGAIRKYLDSVEDRQTVLLLDRYDASTYVYQGLVHRPELASVYEKVATTMNFVTPHLYVFFDVSFEESKRRRMVNVERTADVNVDNDVLEKALGSKDKFDEMRNDYRNFFVSKQMSSQVPFVQIDTTELSEDDKLKVLTEKLDEYLIPISECIGQ